MKKNLLFSLILFFSLVICAQDKTTTIWLGQPSTTWDQYFPVGNGRIGAVNSGDPWHEIIQLNEESLWAGCKSDGNAECSSKIHEIQEALFADDYKLANSLAGSNLLGKPLSVRSYQTFGDLKLNFINYDHHYSSLYPALKELKDYRRELDLETGISKVSFVANGIRFTREIFASAPDNVIVIKIYADKPEVISFVMSYERRCDATAFPLSDNTLQISGQIIDLLSEHCSVPGLHMKFNGLIKGVNKGGTLKTINNSIYVDKADEVVLYVAMNTDYNFSKLDFDRNIDPLALCKTQLQKIDNDSYDMIRERHVKEHSSMFNRVSLSIGDPSRDSVATDVRLKEVSEGKSDPALAALYFQFGRYLLMGSSRCPGHLPANLQGIWCKEISGAWNSDYHSNINIQMNYWPAEVCNLSETLIPLSDWINAIAATSGKVTASKTFDSKGWTINHTSDPFGNSSIHDSYQCGTLPIGGSWLVLHQWEHFLFTRDMDYLRSVYPTIKGSVEFILSFLKEDKHGYLVTAPSNSPENAFKLPSGEVSNLTYGPTMDVEIIMELFSAFKSASKLLNTDKDIVSKIDATLPKLPPIQISKRYKTIQEWIEDYEETEPGHRHLSPLFALYPGNQINESTPELLDAARRTMERRRIYSEGNFKGSYIGWTRAWMISLYARLYDGEEAGRNVDLLLKRSTYPNLWDVFPPFQIDGNFGGTAAIAEMLLQSQNGDIHLLPAIPTSWPSGEVKGLRARGGYTVDIKWDNCKLTSFSITPDFDGKCVVRYGNNTKKISLKSKVTYTATEL